MRARISLRSRMVRAAAVVTGSLLCAGLAGCSAAGPGPTPGSAAAETAAATAPATNTAPPTPPPASALQTPSLTGIAPPATFLPSIAVASPVRGLRQPVGVTHAGDGTGRLFVLEQGGLIRVVRNGAVSPAPFLDIRDRVSCCGERGLLGLAFPPGYAQKGRFYVDYTDRSGNTVIARYRLSSNPDSADAGSEQVVLRIAQPYANHNGGQLAFGRDGYLYIGMGDGGSAGDPQNRAQSPAELLGKLLRIDVETDDPATYTVPPTNPFVGNATYRAEIWALGLRNPWRFSFDRLTGDLFVADVGQGRYEEIDFQPAGDPGGENYGWRIMEGMHCYDSAACNLAGLALPVAEYDHSQGCSVTGGYVYRGQRHPSLYGTYLYADYCSGRVWGLRRSAAGEWESRQLYETGFRVTSFGEDEAGELYVCDYNTGTVWMLGAGE